MGLPLPRPPSSSRPGHLLTRWSPLAGRPRPGSVPPALGGRRHQGLAHVKPWHSESWPGGGHSGRKGASVGSSAPPEPQRSREGPGRGTYPSPRRGGSSRAALAACSGAGSLSFSFDGSPSSEGQCSQRTQLLRGGLLTATLPLGDLGAWIGAPQALPADGWAAALGGLWEPCLQDTCTQVSEFPRELQGPELWPPGGHSPKGSTTIGSGPRAARI